MAYDLDEERSEASERDFASFMSRSGPYYKYYKESDRRAGWKATLVAVFVVGTVANVIIAIIALFNS